jgi:hypothetical protein
MARDVISTCPVCEGELAITRLHCRTCGTSLEGEFGVGRFGRLSREQLALLESFLRSRGNLKDLERELGISYPTVRGRIEAVLRALGLADADETAPDEPAEADAPIPTSDEDAAKRRAILDLLARHEMSAEHAAEALRALGGG